MKISRNTSFVLGAACVVAAFAADARADAIRAGQFTGNTLEGNDDGSTDEVQIGFGLDFYGVSYSSLYVNNNGNVTFDSPLATYTPFGITAGTTAMLAPFFADVDTRDDADLGIQIADVTYGTGTVNGRSAFGVNWIDVGYYLVHDDLLNSFQLVIVDRSDTGAGNFDFEFNYRQLQWETGDASSGIGGFGGDSAHAGWTNGVDTSFEFAGSGVNGAFLDDAAGGLVHHSLDSDVLGRYVFEVRGGVVTTSVTPLPAAAFAGLPLLAGVALLGVLRQRRARLANPR